MISVRTHIVSLAAVFIALAVGLLLGSGGVSSRVLGAVTDHNADLQSQLTTVTAQRDGLAAAARSADEFADRVGPAAIRGTLQGQRILLVTTGPDPADVIAGTGRIGQAGGTSAGTVALTDAVGDPARGDQLRELASRLLPSGAQLPAAADTGSIVGGLVGGTLLGPGADQNGARSVLGGLSAAGFVAPGDQPGPADLVLVITGGALIGVDAGDAAAVVARFTAQLDRLGRRHRRRRGGPRRSRHHQGRLDRGRRAVRHRPHLRRAGTARADGRPGRPLRGLGHRVGRRIAQGVSGTGRNDREGQGSARWSEVLDDGVDVRDVLAAAPRRDVDGVDDGRARIVQHGECAARYRALSEVVRHDRQQ